MVFHAVNVHMTCKKMCKNGLISPGKYHKIPMFLAPPIWIQSDGLDGHASAAHAQAARDFTKAVQGVPWPMSFCVQDVKI